MLHFVDSVKVAYYPLLRSRQNTVTLILQEICVGDISSHFLHLRIRRENLEKNLLIPILSRTKFLMILELIFLQ